MGTPFKADGRDIWESLSGAAHEVISAMSSLNMDPDPLPKEKLDPEDRYLSEVDGWAKHSMEHLRATMMMLRQVEKHAHDMKNEIFRLKMALARKENRNAHV